MQEKMGTNQCGRRKRKKLGEEMGYRLGMPVVERREREEKEQEWRGNGGKKLGAGPPWELEAKKLKKERKSEEREKIREKRRERGEVTWGGMSVVWAGESRWRNEERGKKENRKKIGRKMRGKREKKEEKKMKKVK